MAVGSTIEDLHGGGVDSFRAGRLLGKLRPEEYAALKTDIEKRGVMVSVEVDEDGEILDGHHRVEIADELSLPYETIVRSAWPLNREQSKRQHVYLLNLNRRHLDPLRWGVVFKKMCAERGVAFGEGSSAEKRHSQAATIAALAKDAGVSERTARHRVALAENRVDGVTYPQRPTQSRHNRCKVGRPPAARTCGGTDPRFLRGLACCASWCR